VSELRGQDLLRALERGEVRVAERREDGAWIVNAWVKEGILACFRGARNVPQAWPDGKVAPGAAPASFWDKEGLGPRAFGAEDGVRVVPGGSAIRSGAHLAAGVICMPPCYVNVGAFVDEGTMVDSHALVGSCAQIGKRVHLSAAAQIGGVLEPANARPVIVEDDAFVGGNTGIYEGVLVRRGAVIAAGTILTSGTVVYDLVNERELRGTRERPLEIPELAVLVPGSRPVTQKGPFDLWAAHRRLHVACALIVKYRDERTDRATALEDALR
jgi:2,3,4,5-tetrahydropyridine-2,6-dicarboxylate N-succinyltransferase